VEAGTARPKVDRFFTTCACHSERRESSNEVKNLSSIPGEMLRYAQHDKEPYTVHFDISSMNESGKIPAFAGMTLRLGGMVKRSAALMLWAKSLPKVDHYLTTCAVFWGRAVQITVHFDISSMNEPGKVPASAGMTTQRPHSTEGLLESPTSILAEGSIPIYTPLSVVVQASCLQSMQSGRPYHNNDWQHEQYD